MNLGPYQPDNIYRGECGMMMRKLPDECIDLTVTSPPYDNLRDYKGFTLDWHKVIEQLYRVTKTGGVVVWVVTDATINGSETGTSFRQALYFLDECAFNLHDTMIWEKTGEGAVGSNLCYWQNFEFMFVFSKGRPQSVNLIEDRPNQSHGKTTIVPAGRDTNGIHRSENKTTRKRFGRRFNVWRINQATNSKHKGVFPEKLARDHILSWSNPGDLVLDPFVGSGTTAKMAMQNGRHYLGFDISEEYCELARKRVAWANQPLLVVD